MGKKLDLQGRIFGCLTAVEAKESRKTTSGTAIYWRCVCSCGKEGLYRASALVNGHIKSCGCSRGYKDPTEGNFKGLVRSYRKRARKRGVEFSISDAHFRKLTQSCCTYCGRPPRNEYKRTKGKKPYVYNGLDRLDRRRGYSLTNVVTACDWCNFSRGKKSVGEFTYWLSQVVQHALGKLTAFYLPRLELPLETDEAAPAPLAAAVASQPSKSSRLRRS